MLRLPELADIPGILACQHDTVEALKNSYPELEPWTAEMAEGILANMAHPRGQFQLWLNDESPESYPVAGFMLVKRQRNQPPEPDPTVVNIALVAVRIDGKDDRKRLRRTLLATFPALLRYCRAEGLTWRARILAADARGGFAIEEFAREYLSEGIRISTETQGGRVWRVVRSNPVVKRPEDVAWREP